MDQRKSSSIPKIGGIILKERSLLVVRKITPGDRPEFIIPGGRQEPGESDTDTLRRELDEELGVTLLNATHFGSFDDIAIFENIPIHMEVYLTRIAGVLSPQSEIKEYLWIDRNYESHGHKLGSILAKHVIPKLMERGLM